MSIVDGCRNYAWFHDVAPDEPLGDVPTMLSHSERLMLHWLAREMPLGSDALIVDAGCFLGGSTMALATGLSKRTEKFEFMHNIHSYDMFITPNDGVSLGYIGKGRLPGDTVLDLFAVSTKDFCKQIFVHAGDFLKASAPIGEIDILFADILKTRSLNAKMILDFFPKMAPGRTILIQQDYNDHSVPWVNATMELLKDHFEHLCDQNGSRVYLYSKTISKKLLAQAAKTDDLVAELALLERAVASAANEVSRYHTAVGASWTLLELEGSDAAIRYLDSLPFKQPWRSGEPYIAQIKHAMDYVKDAAGVEQYHKSYFQPQRKR